MIVNKKLLNQILKTINSDSRYKGYRKEIALRYDMNNKLEYSFNCLLFENHDLSDLYNKNELYKSDIQETKNGIKLDFWLYDRNGLQDNCYVYIRKIKKSIYFMSLQPIEDGQLIREAVRALKH